MVLGEHALPSLESTTFKYLGLIFHEYGDMSHATCFLMWRKNQKSVCALILAVVNEART